jgi:membrane protein implicated in regulation of membrane protease activity
MSLRAFHILFIGLAILLAAGCAVWGFANGLAPAFGVVCAVISVALAVYGFYFFKKSRRLIL